MPIRLQYIDGAKISILLPYVRSILNTQHKNPVAPTYPPPTTELETRKRPDHHGAMWRPANRHELGIP